MMPPLTEEKFTYIKENKSDVKCQLLIMMVCGLADVLWITHLFVRFSDSVLIPWLYTTSYVVFHCSLPFVAQ